MCATSAAAILGFLTSVPAVAGVLVAEDFSDSGWTPGYVQATIGYDGTYTGNGVGSDGIIGESFVAPSTGYDLVSVEFTYVANSFGANPTLTFNLYEINAPDGPTDSPLDLSGATSLLGGGSGLSYTVTQETTGVQTVMGVTFTDSDIVSLAADQAYLFAISSSDLNFGMVRRGGGAVLQGGGYTGTSLSDLDWVYSPSVKALMFATYDTAVVPEPATGILGLTALGAMLVYRRRSRL